MKHLSSVKTCVTSSGVVMYVTGKYRTGKIFWLYLVYNACNGRIWRNQKRMPYGGVISKR